MTLLTWGNQQLMPEDKQLIPIDRRSGQPLQLQLSDVASGQPVNRYVIGLAAGADASDAMKKRIKLMQQLPTHATE